MHTVSSKLIALDRKLCLFINSLAGNSRIFDVLAVIFAEGIVYMIGSGVLIYILTLPRTDVQVRFIVQVILASLIARFAFVSGIRLLGFRYRPFWYENITQLVPHNPLEASFPSGHAAIMGAMVTLMFYIDKKWGAVFAVFALLSGIARVVVGVHFPFDIVVGFACGIASAILVKILFS